MPARSEELTGKLCARNACTVPITLGEPSLQGSWGAAIQRLVPFAMMRLWGMGLSKMCGSTLGSNRA